jgi:hypothetical protein
MGLDGATVRAAQRVRARIDTVVTDVILWIKNSMDSMVVIHMSAVAAVINMTLIGRSDAWPTSPSVLCITMPQNDMVFSMLTRETMTGGSAKRKTWKVS